MDVVVLPDPRALAAYAADLIEHELAPGSNLGLAGGSTPAATYAELASRGFPWSNFVLWLSDERWVAPTHPDSNARMALDAAGGAIEDSLLAIQWGADIAPIEAAARYDHLLIERIGNGAEPRPGIVLLGVGDDCHTASLFPGTDALSVSDRNYVANHVPGKGWRLTATIPMLHRADHLVFLVQGSGKAAALVEILEGDGQTPAALVAQGASRVTWVIDEAAAGLLTRPGPLGRHRNAK